MTTRPTPDMRRPYVRLPRWRSAPPTAGLPLRFADFFARDDGFEAAAARYLGVERLSLFCSGTAAFTVALRALSRLSPRRTVVAPAYTCPLVAIAVARAGLDLKLCDLAPDSFDMDARGLEAACGPDTLAVVPTHLAGQVGDVAEAVRIGRAAGAYVIEDAAQSFGARIGAEPAGLSGDFGFYSLAVGKGLTLYEGGLLWARDVGLAEAAQRAAVQLIRPEPQTERRRAIELAAYAAFYRPSLLRLAYDAPLRRALKRGDVEGAVGDRFPLSPPLHEVGAFRRRVGVAALERLGVFQQTSRARGLRRAAELTALPGVTVFGETPGRRGTWPYLFVLMPDARSRDAALATLWTAGLGVSRLFARALPDYGYLSTNVPQTDAPNARALAARSLTITNSPWLGDDDFARIAETLSAAIGG